MGLRSGVAVAVVEAGSYSSDLTPSLGTSISCGCSTKKTKKKKEKKEREMKRERKEKEGRKEEKERKKERKLYANITDKYKCKNS